MLRTEFLVEEKTIIYTQGEIHVLIFRKLASFVIGLKVSCSNITVKGSYWGEKSYFSDSECFHKLQIFGLVT